MALWVEQPAGGFIMRNAFMAMSFAILLMVVPFARNVALSASAQQTATTTTQHEHDQAAAKSNMQEMMKAHQQMMAEMKAGDGKLDELVTQMNAAAGDAKVNATVAVVSELVRQQKAMHERMGHMHEHMMRGMMMNR
jgi:hypothetical protein